MSLWLFATYEDTPMFHLQKKKNANIPFFYRSLHGSHSLKHHHLGIKLYKGGTWVPIKILLTSSALPFHYYFLKEMGMLFYNTCHGYYWLNLWEYIVFQYRFP